MARGHESLSGGMRIKIIKIVIYMHLTNDIDDANCEAETNITVFERLENYFLLGSEKL